MSYSPPADTEIGCQGTLNRQVWVELQMHVSTTAAPGDFHFIQRTGYTLSAGTLGVEG
jgi:hypothetical protein